MTGQPAERSASNGEAFRPDAAALIGSAVGKHLAGLFAEMLPQLIGNAFASVLEQIPVRTGRLCCKCLAARIAWETVNATAINDALYAAMADEGITDRGDPRVRTLDVSAFLPDGLAGPPVNDAVTITGGEEVCALHLTGTPQQPPGEPPHAGRRPYVVATLGTSVAGLTGQG